MAPLQFFGRSLRSYVLSIVLFGAVVPLALVGAWLTRGGVRSGEALLERQLNASLDNVMGAMARRWDFRRGDLLLLAESPAARRTVAGAATASDSAFLEQAAAAIDKSILSFDYVDTFARSHWSSTAMSSGESLARPTRVVPIGPVLDVDFPVRDAVGATIGAVRARVQLSGILVTDSARLIVPGSALAAREVGTGRVLVALADALEFPRPGRQSIRGTAWLAVTRRPVEPSIEVALAAATGPYVAPFEHAATVGLAALALVGLASLTAAILMTNRLARTVDRVVIAADSVSRGDFAGEVHVASGGPVEFQRLARAFNMMTESLRRLLSELSQRRALAAVGEFAAALSHEVRNTLMPVEIDLERAQERVADAEDARTQALVTRALSQVRRLESAVTGALAIARSGHVVATDVDLQEVLRTAVDGAQSAFQASGSRIELASAEQTLWVRGDPDALRHLFVNLLLNAGQVLPAGGVARVETARDRDGVTVSVVDNGPGISEEDLARAGQAFFTTRPGGTGLGLPIARQIAAAHGGALEIASSGGRGTAVRVTLPLAYGSSPKHL